MKINGYASISQDRLIEMCDIVIQGVAARRAVMKKETIKKYRDSVGKATWWGFKSGRKISKKTAEAELKSISRNSMFPYGCEWIHSSTAQLDLAKEYKAAAENMEGDDKVYIQTSFFKTHEVFKTWCS